MCVYFGVGDESTSVCEPLDSGVGIAEPLLEHLG